MPHKVWEYNTKFDARPPKGAAAARAYWEEWNKKARDYGHDGEGFFSSIANNLFVSREDQRKPAPAAPAGELPLWQKGLLFLASPVKYLSGTAKIEVEKEGGGFIGSITKLVLVSIGGLLLILLVGTFLFFSVKKAAS